MPTPLEVLLDPLSLFVLGLYAAFMLWEALRPARQLPAVPHWRMIGLASFVAYFFLSTYLPLFWDSALAEHRLLDLRGLGHVGGAAVALLVYELAVYAWHRTMHAVTPLWRSFHQMHHSAERIDTYGAFFFSPLDMVGWTAHASLVLTLVIGVTPEATTATLLFVTLLTIFQHANIRTPRWLGYFVQRPESHSVHHERGVHAKNYADLPVFDLIFGTFENPEGFADESGFYDGASARVLDMLLLQDVSSPPAAHDNPIRGRLNAAFFWAMDGYMHWKYGAKKAALLAEHPDSLVELGAGTGANFRYLRRGTRVVAIEPNPHMHAALRRSAERWGIELEIRGLRDGGIDLPTASAEAIVGSLVLCTVESPERTLAEVQRVLVPGGAFLCIEHVAAPSDTFVGRVQRWVFGPWRYVFEGCHTHRHTASLLRDAGFQSVALERFTLPSVFLPVRPHIVARCHV